MQRDTRFMKQPIRIIGSFASPYVRKVLACMELKKLEFEVDPITAFFGNDEFERLSPLRRIPVMIDGEVAISDSSVVCAYLDEAYPERPLLPVTPAERASARWLEEFADTRLGDLFIWSLFYQRFVRRLVWGEEPDEDRVKRTVETDIPRALDYLEGQLPSDGFLFGDIGLADISVASFFQNAFHVGWSIDAERWPVTAAFVQRALGHEAFSRLLRFESIQLSASIKGRRQALLDAGAPLTEDTMGVREPKRGMMRL